MNEELYQQNILEHYKNPQHKGVLDPADASARKINQYCGDDLTFYLRVNDGTISEVAFDGEGCAISIAGASMLSETLVGMPLTKAKRITEEDVYALFGVSIGPARAKCALLAHGAIKDALNTYV